MGRSVASKRNSKRRKVDYGREPVFDFVPLSCREGELLYTLRGVDEAAHSAAMSGKAYEGSLRELDKKWMRIFTMIRDRTPYCTMFNAQVEDGIIRSWDDIQQTYIFGRRTQELRQAPSQPDISWQQFVKFCRKKGNATLAEVHFTNARPVLVKSKKGPGTFKFGQQ